MKKSLDLEIIHKIEHNTFLQYSFAPRITYQVYNLFLDSQFGSFPQEIFNLWSMLSGRIFLEMFIGESSTFHLTSIFFESFYWKEQYILLFYPVLVNFNTTITASIWKKQLESKQNQ